MSQEESKVEDVEEGEISDTASIEEISEGDFNKQEVKTVKEDAKGKAGSKIWTMQDLYKYQVKRGYTSGLHNLAWAQAVQNKRLNEVIDLEAGQDENVNSNQSSSAASSNTKHGKNGLVLLKEGDKVVIDVTGDEVDGEKEEGELEEGEIDLDSEPSDKVARDAKEEHLTVVQVKSDKSSKECEISEALESIIASNPATSLDGVSAKLERSLEGIREMVLTDGLPSNGGLLELLFGAVQAVYRSFCSMDFVIKEQTKESLKRVLSLVINASFLPPEQVKEIEEMVRSLTTADVLPSIKSSDKERDMKSISVLNEGNSVTTALSAHSLNNSSNASLGSLAVESTSRNNRKLTSEAWKQGLSSIKGRGFLTPLLDLHKDHDADSLPSPTREAPPALTIPRFTNADRTVKPDFSNNRLVSKTEDFKMHPYETEAVKMLSSYQQKFGRNSSFSGDKFPSPTPSEEHDGVTDSGEEVSSSLVSNSDSPSTTRSAFALSSQHDVSMQGVAAARSTLPNTVPNPPVKSSVKSRDPRLRFVNADSGSLELNQGPAPLLKNAPQTEPVGAIAGLKKHSRIEDPRINGPDPKRPRNGLENPGVSDVKVLPRTSSLMGGSDMSGWQAFNRNQLVQNVHDPRKIGNGVAHSPMDINKPNVAGNASNPLGMPISSATVPSWNALLKGISGNPAMLVNLLKMGQQQKLTAEMQLKIPETLKGIIDPSSSSSMLGIVPPPVTSPMASGAFQNSAVRPQAPAETPYTDDQGKVRMKPRDPRRVLHGSGLQRTASLGVEQLKSGPLASRSQIDGVADQKTVPTQPAVAPDIAQQFTKNLRNMADIISASPALPTLSVPPSPVVPRSFASQPPQTTGIDVRAASPNITQPQKGPTAVPDGGAVAPPPSQSSWADVEHLFEGYDDKQRADIQRERARRIEEQQKMFAERKLCLVLDLDHTLLNSAKFSEVEPVHDEMLRKKEEQDRDKQFRHLYRLPHMGMWTKLRPGVWNFLERASKLFELHLYTMGNKLYATEMAKVLDPKGALFAGRVISRGDEVDAADGDDRYKVKDLEGVLGMESAVLIIDDSIRVWPHNRMNLIVVERYTYFPSSRRQFGMLGPSLLEIDHDERPEDGTLASSLAVIERVHKIFFSQPCLDEVDVRNILASEQRKILAGCRIVFSRVIPVTDANPHLHPLWLMAEQFGAVCTYHMDDQVTHVVANAPGTNKVNWAISSGKFVVHPSWVEASALLYRRANEQDFAIKL